MLQLLEAHDKYSTEQTRRQLPIEERNQLIEKYLPLVKWTAYRIMSRFPDGTEVDDLISFGTFGLIDALQKYEPSFGVTFENYAKIRIRGAILDELRHMDWVPRSMRLRGTALAHAMEALTARLGRDPEDEEIAAEMQISMDEYHELLNDVRGISIHPEDITEICAIEGGPTAPQSTDPFFNLHRSELKEHLANAIKSLPHREQTILSLYYYEELTMKEIGDILGYTESRISQIHTKSVLRLRLKLSNILKGVDLPEGMSILPIGEGQKKPVKAKRK